MEGAVHYSFVCSSGRTKTSETERGLESLPLPKGEMFRGWMYLPLRSSVEAQPNTVSMGAGKNFLSAVDAGRAMIAAKSRSLAFGEPIRFFVQGKSKPRNRREGSL